MGLLLAAVVVQAKPPPAKTVELDRLGVTKRCDRAPGLMGWLARERRVFGVAKLLKRDPLARAVVVSFFATWCKPCREGLQQLQRAAPELRTRGGRVLLVAVPPFDEGDPPGAWLDGLGVRLPAIHDKFGALTERWLHERRGMAAATVTLPRTVVLNRNGRLVAVFGQEGADFPVRLQQAVERADKGACPTK